MNSVKLSVIFVIVGFIGIAGSYYGDVIDDSYVLGFALALAVVGFALALAFIVDAMNSEIKEKKNEKEKRG